MVEITFVRKFFVHKVRNHNYRKSFEFEIHEIIIIVPNSSTSWVQPLTGQRFNREFTFLFQISWICVLCRVLSLNILTMSNH